MQNEQLSASTDEIGLSELWNIVVRGKLWILGTAFVAVILALIAVTAMRPQWEATAVIRIGAVGQVGQVGQAGTLIEPVARAVERMKLKSFEDAVLSSLGMSLAETDPESNLFRNSLKIKPLTSTDLIEISVRSFSLESDRSLMGTVSQRWARSFDPAQKENAKRPVLATIAYLRSVHDALAVPSIERLKVLLAQLEQQIGRTSAERDKLARMTDPQDKTAFMERVVASNTLVQRDGELRGLQQAKTGYEEQLGPLRTYPTSLLEGISVSERPVAPKKSLVVVLAGIFGLFVGLVVAFLSHSVRLRKQSGPAE